MVADDDAALAAAATMLRSMQVLKGEGENWEANTKAADATRESRFLRRRAFRWSQLLLLRLPTVCCDRTTTIETADW